MVISQREARRLRKRVAELEYLQSRQRSQWATDYPGGTHIGTASIHEITTACVSTARRLGHAVVAVNATDGLRLYALPLREQP